jgi:hypothetical protein
MIVTLYCTGRGTARPHRRRVTVYTYDGPVPVPAGWLAYPPGSDLDLACKRCGLAPRPGNDGMRALIELAASQPHGELDISSRGY